MQLRLIAMGACLIWTMPLFPAIGQDRTPNFIHLDGAVQVQIAGQNVATYVYRDPQLGRPYWHDIKTTSGIQVSRNHPPLKGQDLDDHAGLHTGIWLSFGDLSGQDFWRLKAKVEHDRFEITPEDGQQQGRFRVVNHYRSANGASLVARETTEFRFTCIDDDYLLDWESTFTGIADPLVFGDQEEMGLAVRVATPLAVDSNLGGRILDSEGRRNGSQIWGQTARWCDYSGPSNEKWVGIAVLTAPDNFRACWCHARDYGLVVMNPFGRKSFTGSNVSRVEVPRGEEFRLRFGILVHQDPNEEDFSSSIDEAWKQFEKPK